MTMAATQGTGHSTAGATLVLGMGGTGVSFARYLASRGTSAVFADTRPFPPGMAAIRAAMPAAASTPAAAPPGKADRDAP